MSTYITYEQTLKLFLTTTVLTGLFLLGATPASAHCDTMDGPVITAAQRALNENNVNLVLVWVQPDDEGAIKTAFAKAITERQVNPRDKTAEIEFFETLVRIHRAGEGASYDGIKPAGTPVEPVVAKADSSISKKDATEIVSFVSDAVAERLDKMFSEAIELSNYDANDTVAGREYVRAYVSAVHFAEGMYAMAESQTINHAEGHAGHVDEAGMSAHEAHTVSQEHTGDSHSDNAHHDEDEPKLVAALVLAFAIVGGWFMMRRSKKCNKHHTTLPQ